MPGFAFGGPGKSGHVRVSRRVVSLLVIVCALAGCGGPVQREELGRGIDSLRSIAAEGSVLARGVADNRTRSAFVRVQTRALSDDADHEAEKLNDAQAL